MFAQSVSYKVLCTLLEACGGRERRIRELDDAAGPHNRIDVLGERPKTSIADRLYFLLSFSCARMPPIENLSTDSNLLRRGNRGAEGRRSALERIITSRTIDL